MTCGGNGLDAAGHKAQGNGVAAFFAAPLRFYPPLDRARSCACPYPHRHPAGQPPRPTRMRPPPLFQQPSQAGSPRLTWPWLESTQRPPSHHSSTHPPSRLLWKKFSPYLFPPSPMCPAKLAPCSPMCSLPNYAMHVRMALGALFGSRSLPRPPSGHHLGRGGGNVMQLLPISPPDSAGGKRGTSSPSGQKPAQMAAIRHQALGWRPICWHNFRIIDAA